MNIEVRYQSRNGNTKKMAEIIAETVGCEAKSISDPVQEEVDILFLGGGVYMWNADPELIKYVEQLDSTKVKKVVAFSTTGVMSVAIKQIIEAARKRNIPASDQSLCIVMGAKGHSFLGLEGGKFSEKQTEEVQEFAKKACGENR